MADQCPIEARVEALENNQKTLEEEQKRHGEYLKGISENVECMAKSMKQLVEIIPLITMAQAIRSVAVWITPVLAAIAAIGSGVYWLLDKSHG